MDPDNRDFLKLVRDTEANLTALLTLLGANLARIITSKASRGRRSQQSLIDSAIRQYVESYKIVVTDAVATAGGLQADKNATILLPLLGDAGADNEQEFMGNRFAGYQELVRRRFPTLKHPEDLRTFEQRVQTIRKGFQSTVYRMVQQGVDEGIDPRKLAFQIRDAVVMTPKGNSLSFREAARLRDRASTYVYRGAPRGSIQYNSMRIVRTEMAGIYRRSVTDFYGDRPYLEEYKWLLSNRHRKIDRCDDSARGGPYRSQKEIPGTHPLCLCRVIAQVMSQEKLKTLLASGALD